MKIFNVLAFDELISGAASPWYSSADLADQLGTADGLLFAARATRVSGTSPTLTLNVEISPDGQHWTSAWGVPQINAASLTEGVLLAAGAQGTLAHARFSVTLGGTAPACRLKVYVTGTGMGR